MRERDKREIFRLIEREAGKGASMSATVEKIREDFDISVYKAEAAVVLWIQQGGKVKAEAR
jgi:delta 1-pyrroline-5-carboxylate dehydrogenase